MSKRAKELIQNLCGDDVEFLRFHDLKGKPYYAMNVLRVVDVLDIESCDGARDDSGKLFYANKFSFKKSAKNLPPMFKEPVFLTTIFVTEPFANMAIENELTGLALSDPSIDELSLIVQSKDLNVVEGIIT